MAGVTSNTQSMVSVKEIAVGVLVCYVIFLIKISVIIVVYKLLLYGDNFKTLKITRKRL